MKIFKAFLRPFFIPAKKLTGKILNPIMKRILRDSTQDIALELQRRALISTVDYVQKNMKDVNSVASNYDLLKLSLNEVNLDDNRLVCEFGVFSGKTINHIASHIKRNVYGFDSFDGLPERWRDGFDKGHFKVSSLPKVSANVTLIKGWFDETLPQFLKEHPEPVGFIHIDCDLYSSTKTIFNLCRDRIMSGTVIVFDEYFNYSEWENGEYKAFQEFINSTGLKYQYLGYNRCHEQVAVKII